MQTDQLIHGNAYTYLDDDNQARRCLFDRTVILPNNGCGYRFRIESNDSPKGICKNLTGEEVLNRIFRASYVSQV